MADDKAKTRTIWASAEEKKLALAIIQLKRGNATTEQLTLLAGIKPSDPTVSTEADSGDSTGPSNDDVLLLTDRPTETAEHEPSRAPGPLSLDDEPSTTDPLSGPHVPLGARVSPPASDANEDEEASNNPWTGKKKWSFAKKVVGAIVGKVPIQNSQREEVLRYLTVNAIPRYENAPFVSTEYFQRILRENHVSDEEVQRLLEMPPKMSQAFYTSIVSSTAGDKNAGLTPFIV